MPLPSHDEQELAAKMLEAYGLTATAVTPVRSWNTSVVRADTARGSYALRLHRPGFRSEAQIRGELAFLEHLVSCELAVPVPVPTSTGELLLRSEEGLAPRYCDVTTWLEGVVRRQLEPTDAYQLGVMLARIHLAARAFVLPSDAELPHYDAASLLTEVFPNDSEPLGKWFSEADLEVIHEVTRQAQSVFVQLAHEKGEVGTIHNDFILGNCLWHANEVRVLDFADCGVGPYLYDHATMLTNFSDETLVREGFLEGYSSLRPLSLEHTRVLPLLEAVRHVRVCLWHMGKVQRGEVAPPLERHLEARMSEVRRLMS